MSRRPMLAAAVAALCLLSFGCSSDKEEEGASTTTAASQSGGVTTTAGASETTAPTAGGDDSTSTTAAGAGAGGGSSNPCEVLTGEEFAAATGVSVSAEPDRFTGGCAYWDQGRKSVALLLVEPGAGPSAVNFYLGAGAPDAPDRYESVDAGDGAAINLKTGHVYVVTGGNGYNLSVTGISVSKNLLSALAEAIATG
ncbi:MAG: hypothetical protein KatS3mg008_0456 [Acidimicrobiales bacterium]|nr:MAG: hypothetical protein KatS3mg008_0456 [Acidimicrobiales bacterium]